MTLCHPQPISIVNLLVEDLHDGYGARMGGSLETAIRVLVQVNRNIDYFLVGERV